MSCASSEWTKTPPWTPSSCWTLALPNCLLASVTTPTVETVTYLLKGRFFHEDFKGTKGELGPGDVQWMTAGKGILHSEMPASFTEPSTAFQLWLNLDSKNKFCDPRYQQFRASEIPTYEDASIKTKVISGEVFGVKGLIEAITPAHYIDFNMGSGKSYEHVIPAGCNYMVVVYQGSLEVLNGPTLLEYGGGVYCVQDQ